MKNWLIMASLLLIGAPALAQVPDGPDDEPSPAQGEPPPPPALPPPLPESPPPLPPLAPLPPFQRIAPAPPPTMDEILHLESSGKGMKAGGAVLIAFGAALEIAGDVMTLHSQLAATSVCRGNTCSTDYNKSELIAGVVSSLAAGGLLYGGVAILSAGGARIRRAQTLRYRISPQFSSQQASANFGLTF